MNKSMCILIFDTLILCFFQNEKNSTQKRHTPITFGSDNTNKRIKEDKNSKREIYTPPSGKYSSNISSNYGKQTVIVIKFDK